MRSAGPAARTGESGTRDVRISCRAGAPAAQRFRDKASNRWAQKSREGSKQDPGLGDEPSCPYQFHVKESRANQPGFVVFWPAIPVCSRLRRWPVVIIPPGLRSHTKVNLSVRRREPASLNFPFARSKQMVSGTILGRNPQAESFAQVAAVRLLPGLRSPTRSAGFLRDRVGRRGWRERSRR
jgi:hypothetical protein